jgi:F-type H+-transporting ATPase subunit delta
MISAVGIRYAKALLDIVMAPGSGVEPQAVLENLRAVADAIDTSATLKAALLSPAVPPGRKRAVIGRLIEPLHVAKQVRNFLYVVVDHRRIMQIDSIVDAYEQLLDERLGYVGVEISSASLLDSSQRSALEDRLSGMAKKKAKAAYTVDPSIIGGVVARVGSVVYDGSVRGQLERLRIKLLSE